MSSHYRPDIDGIRALAVVPVVFFHAQILGLTGGFVGVDVFFVISGYLITDLIRREIDAGSFSYLGFWERRARRLVPPMVVVVVATLVASWFVLLPIELRSVGSSAVGFSAFLSNVYFWSKSGYFGAPAELIPLLHTWSLAVEEQFYLIFPAVLIFLTRKSPLMRHWWVAAIGLASFVVSAMTVNDHPDAAYYLLHSRAWELLLGAYLALQAHRTRAISGVQADCLLVIGTLLVLVPTFW